MISLPLLAALFSALGIYGGYLVGVRLIWHRRRRLLGADAGGRGLALRCFNGVIRAWVFAVAVGLIAVFEGYDANPTAEGRLGGHHAHRRDIGAGNSGA